MKTTSFSLRNALRIDSSVCQLSLIFLFFASFAISPGLKAQTILWEDFETNGSLPGALPAGWVSSDVLALNTNTTTPAFKLWSPESVNSTGRWVIPQRTGSSSFAAANDRVTPCDCNYSNSYLQTPILDFTGIENPGMRFVIFNDDFRSSASAFASYSLDEGLSWTTIPYYPNTSITFPEHPSQWKMVAFSLDTLFNEPNVIFRFNWNDGNNSTNGFALDDLFIGSMDNYSVGNERLNYGNYVAPNFSEYNHYYTMIPLNQAHAVSGSSMIYNNGLQDALGLQMNLEILRDGQTLYSGQSSMLNSLGYLRKEYLTVQSNFIPTALGNYIIRSSINSNSGDTSSEDNYAQNTFIITACTYALDQGDAIGAYIIDPLSHAGNVFHIYEDYAIYSVEAAIYSGTQEGAELYAEIYEITTYDSLSEDVNTTPVLGGVSFVETISSSEMATATENKFVCFQFPEPLILQSGKTYIATIHGDSTYYAAISGGNDFERSWIIDETDSTYSSVNKTLMIRLKGNCSEPCLTENPAGCTNPDACNYNSLAITDDGSCLLVGSSCDDGDANTANDSYSDDCTCSGTQNLNNFIFLNPAICDAHGPELSEFSISVEVRFSEPLINSTIIVELSCGAIGIIESFSGTTATYNFIEIPGTTEICTASAYILGNNTIQIEPASFTTPNCCSSSNYFIGNETTSYCLNDTPEPITSISLAPPMDAFVQWNIVNQNGTLSPIEGATGYYYVPPTNQTGATRYRPTIIEYTGCFINTPDYTVNVIESGDFIGFTNDRNICESHTAIITPFVDPIGGSFIWNTGSTDPILLESPEENTTYYFSYTIGSCIEYSDSISVLVEQLPEITSSNSALCSGESTSIGVFDPTYDITYLWNNGSETSSITVNPLQTTTYYVEMTYNSCVNSLEYCVDEISPIYCNEFTHNLCNPCAVTQELGPQLISCTDYFDYYPQWNSDTNAYSVINYYNFNYYSDDYTQINYCSGITSYHTGAPSIPYLYYNSSIQDSITIYVGSGNSCDDNNPCTIEDFINADCTCTGTPICGEITITQQPQPLQACGGQTVQLSVTATGNNLMYQWYRNGIPVNGATSNALVISSLDNSSAGSYHVVVYNSNDSIISNSVVVDIVSNCNEIIVSGSGCDASVFYLFGQINIVNPPSSGTLTLTSTCGYSQVFNAPFNNVIPFSISVDGNTFPQVCQLEATFSAPNSPIINPTEYILEACCSDTPVFIEDNIPFTAVTCQNTNDTPLEIIVLGGSFGIQWYVSDSPMGPFNIIPNAANTTFAPPTNNLGTKYYYCNVNYYGCGPESYQSNVCAYTVTSTSSFFASIEDREICQGYSTRLTPAVSVFGGNYTWSLSNGLVVGTDGILEVTPETTTNYTINYTIGQCVNYTDIATVTVIQPPTVSVNNASICIGESVTLTATASAPGGTYLWSNGSTSPSITVSPSQSSNYTVTYNTYGCSATNQNCYDQALLDYQNFILTGLAVVQYCDPLIVCSCEGITSELCAGFFGPITTYSYTPCEELLNYSTSGISTVTVLPASSNPNFGSFGPYCVGSSIPSLPTTSTNGITGTWSPAINNQATTTYTFTPNAGQCASSVTRTITITPNTTPSFGSFGPYCVGSNIPALPTTSTNGITGTWSPAINNQATATYTFTPNSGQCASSVTRTISITPNTAPSFGSFGPYCLGSSIPALPTTSTNGITGTWSPAINNQATTTYTFTPNAGQCAQSVSTTITITPLITPAFTLVNSYCSGASISALPTTSNNGFTGTWSPAINNQATTTYTFTPNAGQCAQSVSTTITITPLITPSFNAVNSYCSGASIAALPTTSNNGITGTWSPAINNTQTTNYTFTPNAGQCASQVFLTISILPNTTPIFGNFGPYCAGDIIPALPTTSTNGITGSWSPAINNQVTTTYTFTPTAGQCALSTSTTIVITPQVVPTFNTPSPYCQNSAFPALPTTSNNGVSGTWAPTINNQTTTTYTFTPDADECASSVDITVSILPSVTTAFSIANSYCQGESIPTLPTTSNNGIVGTWSPAINNQSTTAYVFTPNAGQCASIATQTINVSPAVSALITNLSNTTNLSCNNAAITLVASGGNSYSWSGGLGNASVATVTTAGTYTVTVTNGACQATASITITQSPVSTPNAGIDGQTVLCSNAPSTNLFSFLSGSPQTGGTWSGPAGNLPGGLYNPSVHNEGVYYYIVTDASGCGSDTAQVVVEEETFVQATLSYDSPFCRSVNEYLTPTAISPSNGTFTPSPATGLAINANGAINPSLSTAGTYSINYAIGGVCPSQTSALVIIENNPSNVLPSNLIICLGDTESLTATSGEGYTYEWSNGATTQSIQLNASNAGSYFVTITNDAGCTSVSNTATVNAGNAPVPTITPSGSVHICPNTTVQLTASAGSSYEWSTGATTQSINAPAGSYWVTVTNSSGCNGTSETIVVDNENGAGTEIIASGASYTELSEDTLLICEGSALTLTAAPDNQAYLWTTGASSQSITVTNEGVYTVTSLTANGCSGNAQVTVLTNFAPNALTTPSPTLCGNQTAIICASPADTYEWSWNGAVLSTEGCIEIGEAGTYFVTMTNGGICETVDSIEVETISSLTCYLDEDGDGFGYDFIFIEECSCPNGYTSQAGDCDDNDPLQSPAFDEICNDNIDNNCDGQTDENCVVVIAGCTDPSACIGVYNPAATLDDGSCTYPGCTYSDAINFDPQAGCDDGSCEFVETIEGCMDATACNYNASATIDNGSCEYVQPHAIEGGASYQIPESFCDTLYWYPYTEGSTYTWNAGGGSINASTQGQDTTQVYWADQGLGWVSVYETTASGCVGETVVLSVTIQPNPDNSCPNSVEEAMSIEFSAYPNPTTNNFTLLISEAARGAELMVYDALGKLIEQRPLNELQTTIESDTWAAGVYTLLLRHEAGASSLRILKE